ncbi:MAG: type II toxin-antitoxin system HigB family toxin, partial [Caldilineaceae bacterium]|nr:type II toxin-antitoxin system HigB family toxin [Caldilineaceae bacterium]
YIGSALRVLFKSRLHKFWQKHPDARGALQAWLSEVERAQWQMPAQVTERYPSASGVPGNRVAFKYGGNRYRMVVEIDYQRKELYILCLVTHAQYSRIDATEVKPCTPSDQSGAKRTTKRPWPAFAS